MDYYKILGFSTDFLIDMNLSNEDIMGFILDIKVCLDLSMSDGICDKDIFIQSLYKSCEKERSVVIVALLSEMLSPQYIEEYNEKIFC